MFKKRGFALCLCLFVLVAGVSWVVMPTNNHTPGLADSMLLLPTPRTDAEAKGKAGPGDGPGRPESPTKAEAGLPRRPDSLGTQPAVPGTNGIANGGFESGPAIWEEYSTNGWPVIGDSSWLMVAPHSGDWAAWLGDVDPISYISQTVSLPDADSSFIDNFDSDSLDSRWSWVREDPTHWSLTSSPGNLRITTQTGGVYGTSNNQKNLLLTPAPSGDFVITTRVTVAPTQNFQFAALQVYQDDDNYIQVNRAYADGQTLNFDKEAAGVPTSLQIALSGTSLYLRIIRTGDLYIAYYSSDGSSWLQMGQHTASLNNPWIGISAANNTAGISEIPADFDFFELNSGPFLNYWRWIDSIDDCGYDYGGVLINDTTVDVFDLCETTNTDGWVNAFLDLNAYRGQTVTLQFRAETDDTLYSDFYIDDVSLSLEQGRFIYLPLVVKDYCSFSYFDDFSDPNSGWISGEVSDLKYGYLNGEYQMLLKMEGRTRLITPDLVLPENYRIEADMRQVSTAKESHGLVFGARFSGDTYETYQLLIYTPSKEYLIEKRSMSGAWSVLIDWTYSSKINSTGSNHLAVERQGTSIRLYIGGTLVKTFTDASFTGAGRDAGFRVYSGDNTLVDTRFDNFSATCLP